MAISVAIVLVVGLAVGIPLALNKSGTGSTPQTQAGAASSTPSAASGSSSAQPSDTGNISGTALSGALLPSADFGPDLAVASNGDRTGNSDTHPEPAAPFFDASGGCNVLLSSFGLEGYGESAFATTLYAGPQSVPDDQQSLYQETIHRFADATAASAICTKATAALSAYTTATSGEYNGLDDPTSIGSLNWAVSNVTHPAGLGQGALAYVAQAVPASDEIAQDQVIVLNGSDVPYIAYAFSTVAEAMQHTPSVTDTAQKPIASISRTA